MRIADLHCDLLSYLAGKRGRTAENDESNCSLAQLKKGEVILQTLAIFTESDKRSVLSCKRQMEIFRELPQLYPEGFVHLKEFTFPKETRGKINIIAAIENASGLCSEDEDLEQCFSRLESYKKIAGPFLYISLTWNHENRFGGGNLSKAGLKGDGKVLLDYLNGTQTAIDLSHTSDALAHDILNYIDKKGLSLIPIASHSNFRKIANQARNLPDEFAKEIFCRGGIIGMNFVKAFVGRDLPEDFRRHIDYGRSLGGFDQICLGADFFCDSDTPLSLQPFVPFFYDAFGNAGRLQEYVNFLSQYYTHAELEKITHKNFKNYLKRIQHAFSR